MSEKIERQLDLGQYIRNEVLPKDVSVKEAAERLGVGRPALSNFLNGKAALSPDMAARLERSFGADSRKLLELQEQVNRVSRGTSEKTLAVRRYAPNFLIIKAAQIDQWPDNNLDARQHLSVLLRRLIHSTGESLLRVDFPGYDNAQRHGWDGWLEADAATAWIPKGKSGWEFGVDADPRAKAEKAFQSRLSLAASERADCTFIFVTPRNWPAKTVWEKEKSALGLWKAVRVLDASDLEQWLEESVPGQMWLAERLGRPADGCRTLDEYWDRWTSAAQPPLSAALFEPSVSRHRDDFKRWLDNPPEKVFIVSADSTGEAIAFLACLLRDGEIAPRVRDLAAVFESPKTLRSLSTSMAPFIPIAENADVEKELASVYRRFHSIAVRPRNDVHAEPDIALDLLTHDAFTHALSTMGISGDESQRLERESGRSPTILRRRRSSIPAIKTPPWAEDDGMVRSLIPIALLGAWQATSPADTEVLSALAGCPYSQVEENLARLRQADDCPVWSAGQYYGVTSKLDALFALSGHITRHDLAAFFKLANTVLAEEDPALDLPEDKRWAANIYGKVRDHSAALRRGVCETLVILSVHGDEFRRRTNVDVEAEVNRLIRVLLEPLTTAKLLSHERDLPRYAEAAPEAFLGLIEADIKKAEPATLGLLKPVASGLFSNCPRTGLLWALEGLAWKHLGRVSVILAEMSRTRIDDNWANKPIGSLSAIYRAWMPQTAAPVDDRIKSLEVLARRFPDIAWRICLQQFDISSNFGDYSHKPEWRNDAMGAGEPRDGSEPYLFARRALDMALAWPSHTASTLADLVQHLEGIPDEDKTKVWDLIDSWAQRETDEKAKANLRETIRQFAFTRRGRRRGLSAAIASRARAASDKLAPLDPVARNAWLFAKEWVQESAEELADERLDFTKRAERIDAARRVAMHEVWSERGFDGVKELLAGSEAPSAVGRYAAAVIPDTATATDFARACLTLANDPHGKADRCLEGLLVVFEPAARAEVLRAILTGRSAPEVARLLRCAPFRRETWNLADQQGAEVAELYWRDVSPWWRDHTDEDRLEMIDRLLAASRPRAAFFAVHLDWDKVETSRLKRLLQAVGTVGAEDKGSYPVDRHDLSDALSSLGGRPGVTETEMAHLEFLYLRALDHTEHGIPNLERQMAQSPSLFVQALAITFKRSDDGEDPPEWRIDDPERHGALAIATYRLFETIKLTPGTERDGAVNRDKLLHWINETRKLCAEHGRPEIGDQCIGKLLARSAPGSDGSWPSPAVCDAMEAVASPQISNGFRVGVYNARGAVWRGEGGGQERALAAGYRTRAQELAIEYPYLSGVFEDLAASYNRDALREDTKSIVSRRLGR